MTFECTICNDTFKLKHHLQRHMNKKKPCVSKVTEGTIKNISTGSVFNITIDNKMFQISNLDKEQFIRQIMLMAGTDNIKELSNEIKQDIILPETKNNVIVEDNRSEFEKQIDLDNKREEYISKIKKYFHKRGLGIAKKPINRTNPVMSLKAMNDNKKKMNYEIKKAMQLVNIPDEYVYNGEEQKIKIEKLDDKDTIQKFINKSMKLHDEIINLEYKQFNLTDDIEDEHEMTDELKNKRNMLYDIKRVLKLSGVDVKTIQYSPSKIIT